MKYFLIILIFHILASVSNEIDEKHVREYYDRKKKIEKLQIDIRKDREKLENYQQNYEGLKNDWIEKMWDLSILIQPLEGNKLRSNILEV